MTIDQEFADFLETKKKELKQEFMYYTELPESNGAAILAFIAVKTAYENQKLLKKIMSK